MTRALLALALVATSAAAQDDDRIGFALLRTRVQIGAPGPAIALRPTEALRSVRIDLKEKGGARRVTLSSGPLKAGASKELTWRHDVGAVDWEAHVAIVYGDGTKGEFDITVSTAVFPKIASHITKEMVHLDESWLSLTLNQPASRVEIRVIGDDGKQMFEGATDFQDEPAGAPLRVEWQQPDGVAVLKIELIARSSTGFWVGTEITPFEIEIPHEDVNFDTGKAEVTASEAPKIDHTIALLNEKLKRYKGLIKLELFIAGYTDTVGSKGSNQELSERRARAIAAYFQRKGVVIPVHYQGFGEDALAVQTPDETAEARNRRAVYVLAASAPAVQKALPRSAWRRL